MLTIRLQRAGKKNKADFRIVLAEKTAASQKKFLEVIGAYNPHTKTLQLRDQERLNYWVNEQHVELSPTVRNLLVSKEVISGSKAKAFTIPKKEEASEAPVEPASTATETSAESVQEATSEAPAEVPAETTEAATENTEAIDDAPVETPTETSPEDVADSASEVEPAEQA